MNPFGDPAYDHLGRRERQLARLLMQGQGQPRYIEALAGAIGISPVQVRVEVWRLRNKLGNHAVLSSPRQGWYAWGENQQELSR